MVRRSRVVHHVKAWLDAKTVSTLIVAAAGLIGTRHEASVKTQTVDDRVTATAQLAVTANEQADTLTKQIAALRAELNALRARARKAGIKQALAEGSPEPITQPNKPGLISRFWHGIFH